MTENINNDDPTEEKEESFAALLDAYGDKAEAHAAQKANELRQSGEHLHAEAWQQVRKAIKQLRGSHVS